MNKKVNILVADDDPDILGVLSDFLQDEGYSVFSFSNGKEALLKAQEWHVDLAVLDIAMPEINGIETLGKLKELFPGLKAIMITAFRNKEIVDEAYAAGALRCIFKPFDLKDLREAITTALKL